MHIDLLDFIRWFIYKYQTHCNFFYIKVRSSWCDQVACSFSSLLFSSWEKREWNGKPWKLKNVIQFRSGRKETINFRLEMRKVVLVVLAAARCVVALGVEVCKEYQISVVDGDACMHICIGFSRWQQEMCSILLEKEEMKKNLLGVCASICLS